MAAHVWVISELYYPEESATGYYMTNIAEGIAQSWSVRVLCSQPTYAARGTNAPWNEVHHGVRIERCRATRFGKDILVFRLFNLFTISLAIFLKCVLRFQRDDIVLVVTNPPLLPYVVSIACRLRGAKCILRIDDVYPETMIATGMIRAQSFAARFLAMLNRELYRRMDHIIVLGRDMKQLVETKLGRTRKPVDVIPNWADVDLITPTPKSENRLLRELGLNDKFVVQCAGNMGRAQGIEVLMEAANRLRNTDSIHFLFIGSGYKRRWMEKVVKEQQLTNVTLLDSRPRADQQTFLNACDVGIATLLPGTTGVAVPSRVYNILAAGKPIIAIVEPDSEVALLVRENKLGWTIPPNRADALAQVILQAWSSPDALSQIGLQARAVAEASYSRNRIIGLYGGVVERYQPLRESGLRRGVVVSE